ncbi:putative Protein kinase domain-containing protein [Seiridium cardinale]|uniref:Protein kinase domain-containing protein n=1 Tax=Seiridium cardinale TaxID=138064 RepID=A0ABR2XDH3_9PEZI
MATASPTPMGSNSLSAPSRKPSLRSGLRRAPYRPHLDRAQSNPASSAHPSSKSHYAVHNADSSDDEIPVPMKLSALTKALLKDDGAVESAPADYGPSRVRTRAQSHRPSSPMHSVLEQEKSVKRRSIFNSSVASTGEERRATRASSAQQASSRPTSPVRSQASENSPAQKNRKRVVRLSTTPGIATQFGAVQPSKRRSTSLSTSQRGGRPPSRESQVEEKGNVSEANDVNTPQAQGVRNVRIAVGSSDGRSRLSGSSGTSFRRADSVHPPSESEVPEDPVTAPRQRTGLNQGSGSRPRTRDEDNQAIQGSMRVKRAGKVSGSFLRGPARRGLRRQSDEDGGQDGDGLGASQEEAESQAPQDLIDLEPENFASSYYVPDRLASGSPVSAKSSARHQRQRPAAYEGSCLVSRQSSPVRDQEEIHIPHYRVPAPRPDVPARHDQENEPPSTFKRSKALENSILEKELQLPARPISVNNNGARAQSPERKPLAAVNQNEPRRTAPPPPPKMSILEAATSTAGAATTQQAARKRNYMKVNGKYYTRLDSLGRGGSGKVYRVAADNGKMFALKRVSIENADEATVRGLKGEIDLLKRLSGCERVINLFDYEMNEEKQVLSLLMEMGELDLNTLLRMRLSPETGTFDPVFVRYYWQEMLECLAAVHAFDVVHSDLKPANFVLVQGRLKVIDFGIANAIQTEETVNVHRETQVGTPSYMSPESLLDSHTTGPDGRRINTATNRGPKLVKVGKPSDIWGLGCILYQMVYGTTPFGHIQNQMARCHAIIDWDYTITFKERGIGGTTVPPSLLRTMKRCLNRDQHMRPTCEELLSMADPFLHPIDTPEGHLPVSEELLGRIIHSVVARCRERMPTDSEVLSAWPNAYWASVAKAVGRDVR